MRYIVVIISTFLLSFLVCTTSVEAVQGTSKATVEIVGEDDSGNISPNENAGSNQETRVPSKSTSLPKTGEAENPLFLLLGGVVLLLGFVFLFYKKKKRVLLIAFFVLGTGLTSMKAEATVPNHLSMDQIFDFPQGSAILKNSAKLSPDDDGLVILTDNFGQTSAVWSTDTNIMDLTKDFQLETYVRQAASGSASDGLAFVMQAKRPTQTWYTHSLSSLGAYASTGYENAIDGIPYSFAIEFDLYRNSSTENNGHAFDLGLSGQHIANVYPDMIANYETVTSGSNRYRKQLHWNIQDNLKLTDGNWTKLEVRWTAVTSQLSYRTSSEARNYDSGWRHMNPDTIRTELAIKQGNTQAYWGFTGSTGQYNRVDQEVIFTRIPGLVTAKSYIKMNQNGNQVAPGTTLKANSKVQVTLGGQYLSGRQNWQAVNGKVTVPNSLSVVPNTTKVNDRQIDDSHWEGNVLSRASLNDFTLENKEQTITFEAIVKDDMTGESSITGTLEGRNAIVDADAFAFKTSPSDLAFTIVSPEDNRVFFDDITAFPIDITFIDNSKTDMEQSILTAEGEVLQKSTISSDLPTQTYSIDFIDSFNKLAYGKHTLEYRLKNRSGKTVSHSFTLSKQSKPKLEVLENPENSYFVGDKIPFHFNLTDKDSENLSLYMQIDGKEPVKMADYTNDFSTPVNQTYELHTDDFASGIYTFQWFLVDENNNQSPIITYSEKVTIEGMLSFQESPQDFSEVDVTLGGGSKKTSPIQIAVVDTRMAPTPWSLSVLSTTGFRNEEVDKYAPKNFFSYINNEKQTFIEKDSISYLITNHLSKKGEVITLNESANNGFYITPNNGMYEGNYTGKLTWILETTPYE